jgi:hypothetical protein
METTYYALWDLQTNRYLQTGINSTDLDSLLKDFLSYMSVDFEDDEDYTTYYKEYRDKPVSLFSASDFELHEQTEPFQEEE